MTDFLTQNIASAAFLLILGMFGFRAWRASQELRAKGLPVRPAIPADALFGETRASGRFIFNSLNWLNGGASNCLLVWVTRQEFVVDVLFPLNLLTHYMGAIPRARVLIPSITSARQLDARAVEITFPDPDRKPITIRLWLKSPADLISALDRPGSH
jgi:hypothetical protein